MLQERISKTTMLFGRLGINKVKMEEQENFLKTELKNLEKEFKRRKLPIIQKMKIYINH